MRSFTYLLQALLALSAFVNVSDASTAANHVRLERRAGLGFRNGDVGTFQVIRKTEGKKTSIVDGKKVFAWKGSKLDKSGKTLLAKIVVKPGNTFAGRIGFLSQSVISRNRYLGFKPSKSPLHFDLLPFTSPQYPFRLNLTNGHLTLPLYKLAINDDPHSKSQGLISAFPAKSKLPRKHTLVTVKFVKAVKQVKPRFRNGDKGGLRCRRTEGTGPDGTLTDSGRELAWRGSQNDPTGLTLEIEIVTQSGKDTTSSITFRGLSTESSGLYLGLRSPISTEDYTLTMQSSLTYKFTLNQATGELVVPGYYPSLVDEDRVNGNEGFVWYWKNGRQTPEGVNRCRLYFSKTAGKK